MSEIGDGAKARNAQRARDAILSVLTGGREQSIGHLAQMLDAAEERGAQPWRRRWEVLLEAIGVDLVGLDVHADAETLTERGIDRVESMEHAAAERDLVAAVIVDPDSVVGPGGEYSILEAARRLRSRADFEAGVASVLRAMLPNAASTAVRIVPGEATTASGGPAIGGPQSCGRCIDLCECSAEQLDGG